jgi:hypothetical protein
LINENIIDLKHDETSGLGVWFMALDIADGRNEGGLEKTDTISSFRRMKLTSSPKGCPNLNDNSRKAISSLMSGWSKFFAGR